MADFTQALKEQFIGDNYTTKTYNKLQEHNYNNNITILVSKYSLLV